MVSFNRVILAGNLTRDPELRFTNDGIPVCGFGLAVNEKRGKGENAKERVDFFDVTAWRELGETVANYKKKGDADLIEGRLQYRSWADRESGQKRSKVDVVADKIQFLSGNNGDGNGSNGSRNEGRVSAGARSGGGGGGRDEVDLNEEDFDDIPF